VIDAFHVFCMQLTRDLFAIAKFLLSIVVYIVCTINMLVDSRYVVPHGAGRIGFVYSADADADADTDADADADADADLCIRRTMCRHVTIGTPMAIFAVSTVF